jgi:hypothetical protein
LVLPPGNWEFRAPARSSGSSIRALTCHYLTLLGNEVDHLSPIQITVWVAGDKHLAVLFAKISLDTVVAEQLCVESCRSEWI